VSGAYFRDTPSPNTRLEKLAREKNTVAYVGAASATKKVFLTSTPGLETVRRLLASSGPETSDQHCSDFH
jgi:hypothetical protein